MDSTPPVLTTQNLGKRYGTFTALQGLNLSIRPGEIVGLLGPNGSGKTTALRLILGFLKPTTGWSRIGPHDSWEDGQLARAGVAYLPAELRLYDTMTGRELVGWLGSFRPGGADPVRVQALARAFDLDLDRPLRRCSSGMKRKVALLAVLSSRAPLLILDEPTNALDPDMRQALTEQTLQAGREGQAVLFSSHILEEVEAVAHRVLALRQGELVLEKTLDGMKQGVRIRLVLQTQPTIPDPWKNQLQLLPCPAGEVELFATQWTGEMLAWVGGLGGGNIRMKPTGLRQFLEESMPMDAP